MCEAILGHDTSATFCVWRKTTPIWKKQESAGNEAWKRGVETRRGQIWTQTPTSRDLNPMCSNDLSEVGPKLINIYKTLPRALYSHGRAPKSMRQIPFCWVQRKPWFRLDFGLCTRSTTRRGGYRWRSGLKLIKYIVLC